MNCGMLTVEKWILVHQIHFTLAVSSYIHRKLIQNILARISLKRNVDGVICYETIFRRPPAFEYIYSILRFQEV